MRNLSLTALPKKILHPLTTQWAKREGSPSKPGLIKYETEDGDTFYLPFNDSEPVIEFMYGDGDPKVDTSFVIYVDGLSEGESEPIVKAKLVPGTFRITSEDLYEFSHFKDPQAVKDDLVAKGFVYKGNCVMGEPDPFK